VSVIPVSAVISLDPQDLRVYALLSNAQCAGVADPEGSTAATLGVKRHVVRESVTRITDAGFMFNDSCFGFFEKPQPTKTTRTKFNPLDMELPSNLSQEDWAKWVAYRRERGKSIKPTSSKMQLAMLSKQPDTKAVIERSILNGWLGLFEIKVELPRGEKPSAPATAFNEAQEAQ